MNVFAFVAKATVVAASKKETYTNAAAAVKHAALAAASTQTYVNAGRSLQSQVKPVLNRWEKEVNAVKFERRQAETDRRMRGCTNNKQFSTRKQLPSAVITAEFVD